jgi:hypothetical protein
MHGTSRMVLGAVVTGLAFSSLGGQGVAAGGEVKLEHRRTESGRTYTLLARNGHLSADEVCVEVSWRQGRLARCRRAPVKAATFASTVAIDQCDSFDTLIVGITGPDIHRVVIHSGGRKLFSKRTVRLPTRFGLGGGRAFFIATSHGVNPGADTKLSGLDERGQVVVRSGFGRLPLASCAATKKPTPQH